MGFVFWAAKTVNVVVAYGFLVLIFLASFGSDAQILPEEEVKTLQAISSKLEKLNWEVNQNSCIKGEGFDNGVTIADKILRNVTCNCSSTLCHVTLIELKGLNLTGTFPAEFGNLTQLRVLDLTRNYINGTIPPTLARIPLVNLSLLGNRLSGPIPKEIGDIHTLQELVLEDNLLEGNLPDSLGNLTSLDRLLLSANNFTGTIPESYGQLKNLTDFRIDGNGITGKLPEFIGNWIKLDRLDMQGTSMTTPIPSTLSQLTNLTELRISDLNGLTTSFPDLSGMTKLEELVLRNCLITGTIPDNIGQMSVLKTLDLSFNMLTGSIPGTFQTLIDNANNKYMFMSNNSLSGQVSSWITDSQKNIDLSYNNFTGSSETSCRQSPVNLVSSFSSMADDENVWCLEKDLPCSEKANYHSFFINCGGSKLEIDGNNYEEDLTREGQSNFFSASEKWGCSSAGTYMGLEDADYIVSNDFDLNISGPGFYQTARVAPVSLKYYGFCLRKGSYNVKLHFAEIMYSNDQTFSSLGRRLFDVSIQGRLIKKDFNIMEEAGGVGKGFVLEEKDVVVNGSTLEIHLYWAGKGTTAIPDRGVYGPLISAITVTPNYKVDTGSLSAGAIAGIVVASCVLLLLVLGALRRMGYLGRKDIEDKELRGLDLQTGFFTLRQIKAATGDFDPENKIGEGGFGPVYKGELSDGTLIAVKQLSSKSKQGNREFVTEIGMISGLQHPNLVKLYGCCIEGNQMLLIYEYLENNSLARALFGTGERRLHLDWSVRKKICLDIAKGLAYLHEESMLKIVHRDIKATNVLLDRNLNAKISDFGLAKLNEEDNTHISTRVAGTIGYMAPEYAMRGYLTNKADVYSFGIVVLELVSGKSNTNYRPKEEFVYLLDWAYVLQEQGNLLELVDPSLDSNYSHEEATTMLNIGLLCTNPSPTLRPSMSSVVSMLQGNIAVQAPIIRRNSMEQDARFKAFERLSQNSQSYVSESSQDMSQVQKSTMLTDGPWVDSSISAGSSSTKLIKET